MAFGRVHYVGGGGGFCSGVGAVATGGGGAGDGSTRAVGGSGIIFPRCAAARAVGGSGVRCPFAVHVRASDLRMLVTIRSFISSQGCG